MSDRVLRPLPHRKPCISFYAWFKHAESDESMKVCMIVKFYDENTSSAQVLPWMAEPLEWWINGGVRKRTWLLDSAVEVQQERTTSHPDLEWFGAGVYFIVPRRVRAAALGS